MKDGVYPGDVTVNLQLDQAVPTELPIPRLEIQIVREAGVPCNRVVTLEGERIRVGSHPSNELRLEDRSVSRFHCSLAAGTHGWSLTDSSSRNGTFLGGARVRDVDLPRQSCELQLGESTLRLHELGTNVLARIPSCSNLGELYGRSVAMRRVYATLNAVANSEATVLIEGESGTGKELVAHEIVNRGPRANGPLVTVDASSISSSLIESELFGHSKGAFTGADRERKGAFEAANGGTVFLDEIGEMPLDLQPKLLRALESREIRRVGETTARRVDVRVIAATNRNLEREVNLGRFRGDLFFRLAVVTVQLPPLRQRLEDLPLLVHALLESMGALDQAALFTPEVLKEVSGYDWPGNVRELRNYVERAVILGVASSIRGGTQPPQLIDQSDIGPIPGWTDDDLQEPFKVAKERLLTRFEHAYLARLLDSSEGNVSRAARQAKLDRMYLSRLLQRHGLRSKASDV
ncbi:MAG TPA: sigma 54-interacting transcriptional regulator [Polyangiaceae bacterium]|nr:sigma 54-interacting transcriptional regulator [Polyangiaceae bacterium]